jgi:hypothetical protein
METILIAVAVISIAIAVAALVAARRVKFAESQRSEARVAALSAAAETHGPADGGWKQVAGEWQWVATAAAAPAAVAVSAPVRFEDLRFRTESESMAAPTAAPTRYADAPRESSPAIAFGTVERGEATTGRLPLYAAAALILILGSAMLFLRTSSQDDSIAVAQTAAHAVDPLELVSLGHTREANALVISGMVRNPSSGHKVEGLTAVVSLLDKTGALVSTKDVPLDYRALGPGEEAPFKLNVPDPGAVARYRVSFRAGSEVVPHVDRRSETKLASAVR